MMLEPDILDEITAEEVQSIPTDMHGYLLEYVNKNCCSSALCLNAVADYMGSSIYAVSRAFKDITGIGFKDYVTAQRLQYACRLLETTDKTIWEISCESGFENATYFTTVFKHEYGMPPSKYRTKARKAAKQLTVDG